MQVGSQLTVLAVLGEDSGSVPSSKPVAPVSGYPAFSCSLLGCQTCMWYTRPQNTQTQEIKIINIYKIKIKNIIKFSIKLVYIKLIIIRK